jgi:hyaluronan synthase
MSLEDQDTAEALAILMSIGGVNGRPADRYGRDRLPIAPPVRRAPLIPEGVAQPPGPAETAAWRGIASGALTGTILGLVAGLHTERLPGHRIVVRLDWYGAAVMTLLGAKLILSLLASPPARGRPVRRTGVSHHVATIVAMYNEDPGALDACLASLCAQTVAPASLTVVDDGSKDGRAVARARAWERAFAARGIRYRVIVFNRNLGKRHALAAGFDLDPDADVYACVDSDTVLAADALERALVPFSRRRVTAVTGCVLAGNRDTNLLTRLIDLRYASAFLYERAAYSFLGSVLCCCGSLALYRGWVVHKYLDDFLDQQFLGRACTYGDDRRLTYYCLREGQAVLASDAVAWTLVPVRMSHFLRQQLRWSKSFFRESVLMLKSVRPTRMCWWLTFVEIVTWLGFTTALLYALVIRPLLAGHFEPLTYVIAVLLLAYVRAGHFVSAHHPGMTWRERVGTLLIAPLYGVIHMTVLLPLRLVALSRLRDTAWGTRKAVEVEAA